MREISLEKIERDTRDLPDRWRTVLQELLLKGSFTSEAHRFLNSALKAHQDLHESMEKAESILAGDAFIPMAVEVLSESGAPLEEMDSILSEAVSRFKR